MSRVRKPGGKYVNTSRYDSSVTAPGPITRYRLEGTDYKKVDETDYREAKTLRRWLFLKHNMSYKTYRSKSKARREQLREECKQDTGVLYFSEQERREAVTAAVRQHSVERSHDW